MENKPSFIDFLMAMGSVFMIVGLSMLYLFVLHPADIEPLPELEATPIVEETIEIQEIVEPEEELIEEPEEEPKAPILSDEEIIAKVVHQEAKGECLIGQVAVAITIFNRCDYYGKTVEAVVFEPNQYSYNSDVEPYDSCYRAVIIAELIKDFIPDLFPKTMMWFQAGDYHRGDNCGKPYIQIGNHYFNYLPEEEAVNES